MASADSNKKLDDLLLSNIFEIIPEACLIFDEKFKVVKMNAKAEKIFLYSKEYMMSKPFWEIAPQYIKTDIYDALNKVKSDKVEIYCEFTGSITQRWYEVTAKPINNYIIVFISDISAAKHTQKELVRSEERFAAAFKKNPAIMSIMSLDDFRYISANDSFLVNTGFELEEVVGKRKEEVFNFYSEEPLGAMSEFLRNAVAANL